MCLAVSLLLSVSSLYYIDCFIYAQVSEVGFTMAPKQVSRPAAAGRGQISRDFRSVRSSLWQSV